MTRQRFILLLVFGAVLAGASLVLRALTAGKYEVQTTDLIFLVIPLLVVALATGRLTNVDFFGLKADFSELWEKVGRTEIRNQVSETPSPTRQEAVEVDIFESAAKSSLEDLPRVIGSQPEVLEFKLGHGGYGGEAIAEYFDALSGRLRFVVVNDEGNKLFGIYKAPELIGSLQFIGELRSHEEGFKLFANLVNNGDEAARSRLATMSGFVGADDAVTQTMSKRDALAKMEELDTDILPVVDQDRRFVGTVGRSKLTAGLILAVSEKLENR